MNYESVLTSFYESYTMLGNMIAEYKTAIGHAASLYPDKFKKETSSGRILPKNPSQEEVRKAQKELRTTGTLKPTPQGVAMERRSKRLKKIEDYVARKSPKLHNAILDKEKETAHLLNPHRRHAAQERVDNMSIAGKLIKRSQQGKK